MSGQPLPAKTQDAINRAIGATDENAAVESIQQALDPFVLATVDINAESRVKVERGAAEAALVQGGSRFFLVKVLNRCGRDCAATATSPNSGRVFVPSQDRSGAAR